MRQTDKRARLTKHFRKELEMKKYILLIAAFTLFTSVAYAQPWAKMHDEDLMELRLSIGAYLLLDDLQLSPEQKADLVSILDDFRGEQADAEAVLKEFHDKMKNDMTATLERLKSGKGIGEDKAATMKEERDRHFEMMKSVKDKLDARIGEIMDVFTEEQAEKLRNFNPMAKFGAPAVPALLGFMEEMKDSSGEEILEKIRSMSDEDFAKLKKDSFPMGEPGMAPGPEMGMGMGPGMGPDKGPSKGKGPGRLMARFEKIRAMSDEEFQAKKDDMAAFFEKGREMRTRRGGKGHGLEDDRHMMPFMGKAHQHMVRAIILSDGFYEALKSN